eukprot:scaffold7710_cov376-Prasinococcus_capsulatus_cf.AAC.1
MEASIRLGQNLPNRGRARPADEDVNRPWSTPPTLHRAGYPSKVLSVEGGCGRPSVVRTLPPWQRRVGRLQFPHSPLMTLMSTPPAPTCQALSKMYLALQQQQQQQQPAQSSPQSAFHSLQGNAMKQAQSYGELLNSMVAQEQEQRQQQQEPQQNQLVARALNLDPELKQAQGPGADTAFGSNGDVQALLKLLTATAQNGPPTGGVSSSQSDAGTAAALNAALAVISQTLGPGAANLAASASQGLPSGTSLPPVLPSTPVSERSPPGSSPAHTQTPGNSELVQLAVALQQHHDHQQQEQLKRQQQHLQQQISLLHRVQQQQQQQLSGTKRTRLDAGLLDSFAQDHLRAKELQNAILLNSSYGQSHAGPAQRGLSMLEKNFPAGRKGFPMSHRVD